MREREVCVRDSTYSKSWSVYIHKLWTVQLHFLYNRLNWWSMNNFYSDSTSCKLSNFGFHGRTLLAWSICWWSTNAFSCCLFEQTFSLLLREVLSGQMISSSWSESQGSSSAQCLAGSRMFPMIRSVCDLSLFFLSLFCAYNQSWVNECVNLRLAFGLYISGECVWYVLVLCDHLYRVLMEFWDRKWSEIPCLFN